MPADGDLVLEMPPRGGGAKTVSAPGVLYTNNGTDNPPAVLGTLSVVPVGDQLRRRVLRLPDAGAGAGGAVAGKGRTTAFAEGQALGAYTSFVELSKVEPDVKREIMISGGFLNDLASKADPKAFVYAFDGTAFPNVPLIQPRLNSVEEWTLRQPQQ